MIHSRHINELPPPPSQRFAWKIVGLTTLLVNELYEFFSSHDFVFGHNPNIGLARINQIPLSLW